jgi:hypothetical protein
MLDDRREFLLNDAQRHTSEKMNRRPHAPGLGYAT